MLFSEKTKCHIGNFQIAVTTTGKTIEIHGPYAGNSWAQDKYCYDMMSNPNFL